MLPRTIEMEARKRMPVKTKKLHFSRTIVLFQQNLDLVVLLALVVFALSGWILTEVSNHVTEGTSQRYDERILHYLRADNDPTNPIGPLWLEQVWRDLTALGSPSVLFLVTLGVAGYLVICRQYRLVGLLFLTIVGGATITYAMKTYFNRPRPEFMSSLVYESSPSYPSGHSMLSTVVYLTLGSLLAHTVSRMRYKCYFMVVALLFTLLVGISRVYLGVHYPTDVLAGWSTGCMWAIICWLAIHSLQNRGALKKPDPQLF